MLSVGLKPRLVVNNKQCELDRNGFVIVIAPLCSVDQHI